jgi:hypothetical protein
MILGIGCIYAPIPGIKDNEGIQNLGEHFISKGFETAIESSMDIMLEVIKPIIFDASKRPELRVAEVSSIQDTDDIEEQFMESTINKLAL